VPLSEPTWRYTAMLGPSKGFDLLGSTNGGDTIFDLFKVPGARRSVEASITNLDGSRHSLSRSWMDSEGGPHMVLPGSFVMAPQVPSFIDDATTRDHPFVSSAAPRLRGPLNHGM